MATFLLVGSVQEQASWLDQYDRWVDRGGITGHECGEYGPICWMELRRAGIGPMTIHPQTDEYWLVTLSKLSYCESRHRADARNAEGNSPPGSIDRGLWQINDHWWPDVSDGLAYSAAQSTRWAVDKLKRGLHDLWVCWRLIYV